MWFKKNALRRITIFGLYVVTIFALLPFGQTLVASVRSKGLLRGSVYLLTGLIFCFFATKLFPKLKIAPLRGFFFICVLVTIVGTMYYSLTLPEERLHFVQYALLGYLSGWTIEGTSSTSSKKKLFALGCSITFSIGVLDEIVQGLLPMRVFDLHDIFWNMVSGWLGLWTYHFSNA